MAWMFRWFENLLARLPRSRDDGERWVEPSNAITRAIMAASFAPLVAPEYSAEVAVAPEVEAPLPAEVESPAVPEEAPAKEKSKRRVAA